MGALPFVICELFTHTIDSVDAALVLGFEDKEDALVKREALKIGKRKMHKNKNSSMADIGLVNPPENWPV